MGVDVVCSVQCSSCFEVCADPLLPSQIDGASLADLVSLGTLN